MFRSIFKTERVMKGVTLIELAVIMIILAIIAGAAIPRISSLFEDADAQVLRGIAGETEIAISEGLNRGKTLHQLTTNGLGFLDNILGFIEESHGGSVDAEYIDAATFAVSVKGKGIPRKAFYTITTNGNVFITDSTGFNVYFAYAGDLVKNKSKTSSGTILAAVGIATPASSVGTSGSVGSSVPVASTASSVPTASSGTSPSSPSSTPSTPSVPVVPSAPVTPVVPGNASGSSAPSSSVVPVVSSSPVASGNSGTISTPAAPAVKGNNGNAYGKTKGNNGKGNAYAYGKTKGNNGRGNAYAYGRTK